VEHLADELDGRWLVRVLLFELHHQPEGAVLEWCVNWSYYHGVPVVRGLVSVATSSIAEHTHAYQVMTLSGTGDADTPAGGSVCMRCGGYQFPQKSQVAGRVCRMRTLKSRIRRLRAAVDIVNGQEWAA
jgi:hypothetical protein